MLLVGFPKALPLGFVLVPFQGVICYLLIFPRKTRIKAFALTGRHLKNADLPKALPLGFVLVPFQGVIFYLLIFPRRCRWAIGLCPFRASFSTC